MHCPLNSGDGAEIIIGFVADTLDREACSSFRRHLEGCWGCREAVAAQRAVWSALDDWRPGRISPDFDSKLFERIEREEPNRIAPGLAWRPTTWWRPAISVAACLLLAAAALIRYGTPNAAQEAEVQPKVEINQVEHALDDMDLLRQLGVRPGPSKPGPAEKI